MYRYIYMTFNRADKSNVIGWRPRCVTNIGLWKPAKENCDEREPTKENCDEWEPAKKRGRKISSCDTE